MEFDDELEEALNIISRSHIGEDSTAQIITTALEQYANISSQQIMSDSTADYHDLVNREETDRTSVKIPESTLEYLRPWADYHDCSLDALMDDAVMSWMLLEERTAVRFGEDPPTKINDAELIDIYAKHLPLD